jgi:hypothetical protein
MTSYRHGGDHGYSFVGWVQPTKVFQSLGGLHPPYLLLLLAERVKRCTKN